MKFNEETKVVALGGLGEVGKNMYCVIHKDEILIVDCGVMFPESDLMGVDYVLPDYTYLIENKEKVKALIITHGHEDHIGSIAYLLKQMDLPIIYAPRQASRLIAKKLDEHKLGFKNIEVYDDSMKLKFENIEVEFFATTHSIPDSHGMAFKTPNGVIVMTGDFKFDLTPIGPVANFHKIARIGSEGVKLLLSDSTNATVDGYSRSEATVDDALNEIFDKHYDNRLIIATFASNIYRLKHIVETAKAHNRKIALFGKSMTTNIDISIECGYIKEKDIFITPEQANSLPAKEVCILCTGSQGETLAALTRIAGGSHKQIKLQPKDIVVFSSSPIPGNSYGISKTINQLYLKGVKVYTNAFTSEIHTSGHASSDELKLMLRLINPEYFMPYHGEFRMLKAHTNLAVECGIPRENTFVMENGEVLSISKDKVYKSNSIPANDIYVDGNRIGDVCGPIIRDRKMMSNDGVLIVLATVNMKEFRILSSPMISTRGFVLVNENEMLLKNIKQQAHVILVNKLNKKLSYNELKQELIGELSPYIVAKTGRRPIIMPIILTYNG